MLIHTRNKHLDMQSNKLKQRIICMSNTQPMQERKEIALRI